MATDWKTRIEASIEIDMNGCWIWQKTKQRNGYGTFALGGGKNIRAHRASFQCFVGDIPDGADVCHKCDVRDCVNPDHLFLGTRSDNIRDAVSKNRVCRTVRARGSAHPSSKLVEGDVREILAHLANGRSKKSLAKQYGVSQPVIKLIARNQLWKHVERP